MHTSSSHLRLLLRVAVALMACTLCGCSSVTVDSDDGSSSTRGSKSMRVTGPASSHRTQPAATPTGENGLPPAGMPALPPAASANTPEGARAFATYYFAVERAAYTQTRPDFIPPVSHGSCSSCFSATTQLQGVLDDGYRIQGNLSRFTPLEAHRSSSEMINSTMVVFGEFERDPGKRVDAQGRVVNAISAIPKAPMRVGLLWYRGRWLVGDMILSSPSQ